MSDQVKIGGDSTEFVQAVDKAEQRWDRFGKAINRTPDFGDFEKRGRRVIDTTTQSVEASGAAARKAAVDYKRLADESKRASEYIANGGKTGPKPKTAANFRPAGPRTYLHPIAIEEEERLTANAAAVARANARRGSLGGRGIGGAIGARVAGDIINIGTASSGAAMQVNALSHLLGGLAPAAGIVAAVAAARKLYEIAKEASNAIKALNKEVSQKPADVVGKLGSAGIREQIAREGKLAKDAGTKARRADYVERAALPIGGGLVRAASGGEEQHDRLRRDAKARKGELEGKLVDAGAAGVDLAREKANGSAREAALKEAQLETEKKIAAIELDRTISRRTRLQLTEQENEKLAMQKQAIEAAFQAQERQYALAQKLNDMRANGSTTVAQARAHQAAALDDLSAAKASGNDKDIKDATGRVGSTGADLAIALNQQAILEHSVRIAEFRGNQEAETANSLDEQLAAAQKILDADQRRLAVAQARKAISDNETAVELARISRSESVQASRIGASADQASVGASPEQRQRNSLQAQLDIAQKLAAAAKAKWIASKGSAEAEAEAQIAANGVLSAKAALAQFERDTAFANDQELTAAKALTAELLLQASGRDIEAQRVATVASFQERIAKALHDGRTDLAEQLRLQRDITLQSKLADRIGKTPQQRAAEAEAQRAQERDFRTAGFQEKDALEKDQRVSDEKFGFNKRFHPDRVPKDVREADENRGRRIGELNRQLNPESASRPGPLSDGDWHNQFKPLSQDAQAKHEKQNAPDAKPGDSPLLGKIDTLVSTLNELPGKVGVL
jgi:hypothetical protein